MYLICFIYFLPIPNHGPALINGDGFIEIFLNYSVMATEFYKFVCILSRCVCTLYVHFKTLTLKYSNVIYLLVVINIIYCVDNAVIKPFSPGLLSQYIKLLLILFRK